MTKEPAPDQTAIDAADALAAENASRPSSGRRMAEIAGGMGKKIETIQGHDVVVIAITFETRSIHSLNDVPADEETGAPAVKTGDLVEREVAFIEVDAGDGTTERYYTWSVPLIEKLHIVAAADDGLPSVANFNKITLRSGNEAWTIS